MPLQELSSAWDDHDFRRLFLLRGLLFCGQAAAIVSAGIWLGAFAPPLSLAVMVAALVAINLLFWRALGRPAPVVLAQLLVDLAALATLLYFTGGATNPFVWLLLLQLAIAATVLPTGQTWLVAIAATAAYTPLLWFYRPIPGVDIPVESGFELHIIGMWIGFILSALLLAWFLSKMAANVRTRDAALAAAREQALRDERLVGLGTLAAGAAHDLGTPLGTLSALIDDLQAELATNSNGVARRKLELMETQIERCRTAVTSITSSAGLDAARGGQALAVKNFVEATIGEWRARRPDVLVRHRVNGPSSQPRLIAEKNLIGALTNVFDNAADASPTDVDIQADWNDNALTVRVADRGRGFAPEQRGRVGKMLFSDKTGGQGLGLYLSHGIVERLGGKLTIRARAGGGTNVDIHLPLARLRI